ncbi:MAG: hypothetical protein PWR13_563 [Archaeoglobi archaeon]|nr:hypothetical protein [Archaeoglobi archaeon]MDK2781535.1 hypothetical protein [Archaeoglobi archaeon]
MKEERKRSEKRRCVRCGEEFEGTAGDLYCEKCKKDRAYFTLFR